MGLQEREMAGAAADMRRQLLERRLRGRRLVPRAGVDPITRREQDGPVPLSSGQRRLWFLDQLAPGSTEYVVPLALRLTGRLELDALRSALAGLEERHEILRTRYGSFGGDPRQITEPPRHVELPISETTEESLRAVIDSEVARGFDLERGPVWRALLIRLAETAHVLVLTAHHIACDGWSMSILGRELGALYQAAVAGSGRPAPPRLGFADFAVWEQRQLADGALDDQLDYWREALTGLVPLDLPTDRPHGVPRDPSGARILFEVPEDLGRTLLALGRRANATPFMTFLAVFMMLLARQGGQRDVAVAAPVLGRTRPEIEDVVGPFVNTLVLRCEAASDVTFAEFLERVREVCVEAFSQQDLPFDRLVSALPVHRDLSRTPLTSVVFVMEGTDASPPADLTGLACEEIALTPPSVKFDLALGVRDVGSRFIGAFDFATALYDHETVERLAGRYLTLLRAVVAQPGVPLGALDAFAGAKAGQPAALGAAAAAPTQCLHGLVERRAAASPGAPATVFAGSVLTYGEMNSRANRLARHLRSLGTGPESLVGVCLERGPELVPTLLGVLKSGAGYLPVDPSNPAERTRYILADADVHVLVTTADLAASLRGVFVGELVVLDRDSARIGAYPATDPEPLAGPGNVAYVIYTSGSTGHPKGVVVTHANAVRLLATTHTRFGFDETDVWTMFHSYAFDFSVWEIWGALVYGGRVVIVPNLTSRDPGRFLDLLVAQQVTVLSQTPSAFAQLVREDNRRGPSPLRLRTIVFGGEALDFTAVATWAARHGLDCPELVNMYGITETTVHVTYHRVVEADLEPGAGNAVGLPLDDMSIRLVDGFGSLVPDGVAGEIHVAGLGVARGYLSRPALTAERFVPDPFGPAGSRVYRSGDVARRRPDGSLEFLGRIDSQVKIRGHRIEPGEIVETLLGHPAVRDAVVAVREEVPGDRRLVAWLVPAGAGLPSGAELAAHCAAALPGYMVPAAFVQLERLPLTVNGKLDHRALPPPGDTASTAVSVPPRTSQERRIARVWADVLRLEGTGVADDFFAVGGDSMRAVRLVAALREAGVEVTVQDVFQHRTIASLARVAGKPENRVDDLRAEPFALLTAADRAMLPADVVDAYPLAQVQAGMLYEMLADGPLRPYHNVTAYLVHDEDAFSLEALRGAAQCILDRHDVLRTSFHLTGFSEPLQLVHRSARANVAVEDLRALDDARQAEAIRQGVGADRGRLFEIEQAPLWRLHAYRVSDKDWWLAFADCHPILDGWSHNSLLRELLERYRAHGHAREPGPLPAPARRFADFIVIERETLRSEASRSFWADLLAATEGVRIPDGWGAAGPQGVSVSHYVPITDLSERLLHLAVTVGAPPKDVFLAAHAKVMSALTHHATFHFGLVTNGRPEVTGGDEVLGMYLNTVPLAVGRPNSTWRRLIGEVTDAVVALLPHRRYPLPAMLGSSGLGAPPVEIAFNYLDFYLLDDSGIDLAKTQDESPNEFPLQITVVPGHVVLTGRTDRISTGWLNLLGDAYQAVLGSMAEDPDGDATGPVGSLVKGPASPAQARGQAVELTPLTLHELVERQVSATPDATAVISKDGELTYRMLDGQANRLARKLRRLGVTPGSRVAVCLYRSLELVVALLAVLKAGAAFVPLDPDDPAARLGGLIKDSGSDALISDIGRAGLAESAGIPLVSVDLEDDEGPAGRPGVSGLPDDLAYVMYTSGSTGQPKGVMISHRGIVNRLRWAQRIMPVRPQERFLQKTPYTFDPSVPEFFVPLMAGSPVVMAPPEMHRDPVRLAGFMAEHSVTHVHFVPAMLDVFLDTVGSFPDCVRCVICSGEALRRETADRLFQRSSACLLNLYGPTEASVDATWQPVERSGSAHSVPIGLPIDNMQAHVLDPYLNTVPVGVPGELYLGGVGLARGYVSQAALTASRFVPDPHTGDPGARLYRTGDLVRRSGSGSIEYLGRIDRQVKVNGVRVEPSEIEEGVGRHPGVGAAAVVASEDGRGSRRLVAYLVRRDEARIDIDQVRDHARAWLPSTLVPSALVVVDELPLTSSGKIDRNALPIPAAGDDRVPPMLPRTPSEQAIAHVWEQELGVSPVGVHDAFPDIGGHSLLAMRVAARLRAELGLDVTSNDLISRRTIADLASAPLDNRPPTGPFSSPPDQRDVK